MYILHTLFLRFVSSEAMKSTGNWYQVFHCGGEESCKTGVAYTKKRKLFAFLIMSDVDIFSCVC